LPWRESYRDRRVGLPASSVQARSVSATGHAWNGQPHGTWGGSASKISRLDDVEVAGDVPAELGQLSPSALLLADGAGGTFFSGRGRGWRLLRVCQIPPSAEGPVELDVGEEPVQADLRLGVLGGIETLQRVQDLVVAGETIEIAIVGDLD